MTQTLDPQDTDVNGMSGSEQTPKVHKTRTLGFRVTEDEFWAAQERAAESKMDITEWLRSLVEPFLGSPSGERRQVPRRRTPDRRNAA